MAWLDPQVQFQLAVVPIYPLVVPFKTLYPLRCANTGSTDRSHSCAGYWSGVAASQPRQRFPRRAWRNSDSKFG